MFCANSLMRFAIGPYSFCAPGLSRERKTVTIIQQIPVLSGLKSADFRVLTGSMSAASMELAIKININQMHNSYYDYTNILLCQFGLQLAHQQFDRQIEASRRCIADQCHGCGHDEI